jgi:integrase
MVKRIMGHALDDITQAVYTHKTPADYLEAVNMITFVEK